ncbi:hypothetical protein [Clostridium sp. HBUAS56017]|uniref:hypothetical protein n=1 Tax=Clostridium sp. HBUAS56017 TaxID=2571128 RepID=UPI001FAA902E|nr:hypothetical protein [Clostridium sp. HBUAS56017]
MALGASVVAAKSLGLDTVPIGGIRKNPEELIEILGLPTYLCLRLPLIISLNCIKIIVVRQ